MLNILGVDVGGTFVRMGTLRDGKVENLVKRSSSEIFSAPGGAAAGLAQALKEYAGDTQFAAVGVGIPGTVSRDGERVLNVPNIPGLNDTPLRDALTDALNAPVFVENDITMLTTGDSIRLGLERGVVFGCYIGTGLGGAVLVDGKLLRGRSALCEPGHVPIYGLDRPCGCGKTGCAEAYVAGRALERLLAEKYPDGNIADIFDLMSEAELSEYVDILAHLLATAMQLLDPDAVIMGGGVCAMSGFPRELLLERLSQLCMKPVPASTLNLLYPVASDVSGVYGAAVFARNSLI
ncbi:MAG: ROK family protein [Oscillospiraceae bacterium]|nr:ROK family protein [Oscillospiraceae bacterium]